VELSTRYEGLDNIVAFWDPKNKPAPLQKFRFGYRLCWQSAGADLKLSENRVVSMRAGLDTHFENTRQFVMDFVGPKLGAIPENNPPQAIANCSGNAAIVDNLVLRNPFINGWRVVLKMQPKPGNTDPVDLRCTLQNGTNIVSETWTYQWSPP
jgi:glucans biosynthesis protein